MKKTIVTALLMAALIVPLVLPLGALAQGPTFQQLVELFIALGIIAPEKATAARAAVGGGAATIPVASPSVTPPSGSFCYNWTRNLQPGDRGADVDALVTVLVKEGFVANLGHEKILGEDYNRAVASWVSAFQEKYRSEILTPYRLTKGTGVVGEATRVKLNKIYGCPAGGTLMVSLSMTTPAFGTVVASAGATEDQADKVSILAFDARASGADVTIKEIPVSINRSFGSAKATTAYLYEGSTLLDSAPILGNGAFSGNTALFKDLDIRLAANITRTFTVKIDIRDATEATSIFQASYLPSLPRDGAGKFLDVIGSATGNEISVFKKAPVITLISKTITEQTGASWANTSTSTLVATFKLKIKAVGGDIKFTGQDSSFVATKAFNFNVYRNGVRLGMNDLWPSREVVSYYAPSGASTVGQTNGDFVIREGNEVTMDVAYFASGRSASGQSLPVGTYAVELGTVTWIMGTSAYSSNTVGLSEWRTNNISFPNQSSGSTVVNPQPVTPSITVLSPNGGEILSEGQTYTVRWTSKDIPSNAQIIIDVFHSDTASISYPNHQIALLSPGTTSYTWKVEADHGWGIGMSIMQKLARMLGVQTAHAGSDLYTLSVRAFTDKEIAWDSSNSSFRIVSTTYSTGNTGISTGNTGVSAGSPNLTVSAPVITGTLAAGGGILAGSMTLTVPVANRGTASAATSTAQFKWSQDGVNFYNWFTESVPAMQAGESKTVTYTWNGGVGTWYASVCADSVGIVTESNESDNCSSATQFVVTAAETSGLLDFNNASVIQALQNLVRYMTR